jgi:hypothetical protein
MVGLGELGVVETGDRVGLIVLEAEQPVPGEDAAVVRVPVFLDQGMMEPM